MYQSARRCLWLPARSASVHNLKKQMGRIFQAPIATASQAVQSNEVYLPQEALYDFNRLGLAADKC